MTSLVESKAHFEKRCKDMGMSDNAYNSLAVARLDTLGKIALSVTQPGQPGQPLAQDAFDAFARNVLGAMMTQSDAAVLKRIIFEAHTMVLGQLRELVTDPNAAATRKLPAVEREHRMTQLKARLTGVVLERQLEPSHELLETVMQQKEMNQLNYIGLERCSSREWEITMGKSKRQISVDPQNLVIKENRDIPDQFHDSELQAYEALRRRGVAFAFADIMSWDAHERYVQQLMGHLCSDPPPNYHRTTLPQVLKADRQIFLYLIRHGCQLKRLPDNTLDLDVKLFRALESYEVGFHLLPLPKSGKVDASTGPAGLTSSNQSAQQHQHKGGKGKRWEPYYGKGRGYGGKSKGKAGKSPGLLPKTLLGRDNVNTDLHGRRLCFDYQMGKCNAAADGAQCNKGWHLCCRRNCFSPHPEKDHDNRKQ